MAKPEPKLPETETYEADIYQLQPGDRVEGGPNGVSNRQAKQLANRTKWLKAKVDKLLKDTTDIAINKITGLQAALDKKLNSSAFQKATKAEAEAGTDADKVMTPLRTKEAIDKNAVFSDIATEAEARAGTDNTKGMTPLRTKQAISGKANLTGTQTFSGTHHFKVTDNFEITASSGNTIDQNHLHVLQNKVGKDAVMTFHVIGHFAVHFGIDGGLNDFVIGGYSLGAHKYRIWSEYNNAMVGQIAFFAGSATPKGWLLANGAAISRVTYSPLFSVIGTAYGAGDGGTTFNVPDGRGVFLRGLDSGRGLDTGRTLGSYQADAFKAHRHRMYSDSSATGDNLTANDTVNADEGSLNSKHGMEVVGGTETRPKNVAFNMCIKY